MKSCHGDFHNYFISKGIFVQPELKEKIRDLSNMMYDAFSEREFHEENCMVTEHQFDRIDRLHRDGHFALHAIETEVQARLWEANKLD